MRWQTRAATNPNWSQASRVHDWRNYISDEVKRLWDGFSIPQRAALVRQAQAIADREEWD